MLTQAGYFAFDTTSKPGKIICRGIRFEEIEIDGTMAEVKVPILCGDRMPELSPHVKHLISSLSKNF